MQDYINKHELEVLMNSEHRDPHSILGPHMTKKGLLINAFVPGASSATVLDYKNNKSYEMISYNKDGFFTVLLPVKKIIDYKFSFTNQSGDVWESYDPYSFPKVLDELDLYLFGEGTHYEIYNKLGAHPMVLNGVMGVHFAVWAPNAKRVSVIGNFNSWDGRRHQMRVLGNSGIFEIFIPGISSGEIYRYEIKTNEGYLLKKTDPYGNYAEVRPANASIVYDINQYTWNDAEWLENRKNSNYINEPVSIYEVHLGSWKRNNSEYGFMNYRDIAHELAAYVKDLGYTHVELMPITEHPFDGSWGYQVTGYYAPTSRFGTPDDFMYFVDYMHQNGIGVILDWVPAHFPKDTHGLARFDGSALYEHEDPKKGEHPHWGTLIFNYGRHEVKNFLIANALYWLEKYHIDGLRVDAVASMLYLDYGKDYGEWIPNQFGGRENIEAVDFFKHLNSITYGRNQGVMIIAEESTSWPGVSKPVEFGGLGFGYKWNMGWMNDFLRYMQKEPVHKKYHHSDLTFSMVYAYTENFMLVLSHDEVVHGKGSMINKMPGDYWQRFANLRAAYGFMYGHPGKKLLFMGQEFAQFNEWNEARSLDWELLDYDKHNQLKNFIKRLNELYKNEPALYELDMSKAGFEWVNCTNSEASMVSFLRKSGDDKDTLLFVCNFTPMPHDFHKVGVPFAGEYVEILNSDSEEYGGSGVVNVSPVTAVEEDWDGRKYSITVKVPPLGVCVFKIK